MANVVITGASAGVGRATAEVFAEHGWTVGLIARGEAGLDGAKRDVEERGGRAILLPCDVADAGQVRAAAGRFEDEAGPIDVWVNNAMTTVFAPFDRVEPDEYRRVTEVTYLGFVWGTLAALERMKSRNRGLIIQMGSALAYRAIPLQSAYCGAKHAIRGFTDAVRCELLHDGVDVRLTMIQLPAMNTPQFSWCRTRMPRHPQPVPPIFSPRTAARAAYWATGHSRREIELGINTIVLVFLNKWFPGAGDRYLARNGYESQQTDRPVDPETRPSNLFEPQDDHEDRGAYGIFDRRAEMHRFALWVSLHERAVLALLLLIIVAGALLLWI